MSRADDWASRRAPELLRRAEAEAVAELRRLLVDAALAEAAPASRPAPPSESPPAPPPVSPRDRSADHSADERRPRQAARADGHAFWAYCVGRAGDLNAGSAPGVDGGGGVEPYEHDGLVALVSRVPLAEFGEAALRDNLNDLGWLERVARAHETVLEDALPQGPIVPLRLCTIYDSEASLREMLVREDAALHDALTRLEGHEEWGVKLTVDPKALETAARRQDPEVAALEDEVAARSGGGAYMLGRRLERSVAQVTDHVATDLAADVHRRLTDQARDAVLRPVQNRELSGHEGSMLLNAAYLVDADRGAELAALLSELEDQHRDLGATLELTGPWPPYNFVTRAHERSA